MIPHSGQCERHRNGGQASIVQNPVQCIIILKNRTNVSTQATIESISFSHLNVNIFGCKAVLQWIICVTWRGTFCEQIKVLSFYSKRSASRLYPRSTQSSHKSHNIIENLYSCNMAAVDVVVQSVPKIQMQEISKYFCLICPLHK